jgi:hypothetical protein
METLLKIKGLWQYRNFVIPDLMDDHMTFVFKGNKDEVVEVIMTYIS